jgi:hypothetical protein
VRSRRVEPEELLRLARQGVYDLEEVDEMIAEVQHEYKHGASEEVAHKKSREGSSDQSPLRHKKTSHRPRVSKRDEDPTM